MKNNDRHNLIDHPITKWKNIHNQIAISILIIILINIKIISRNHHKTNNKNLLISINFIKKKLKINRIKKSHITNQNNKKYHQLLFLTVSMHI